ncbi:MAG: hypothetical protein ACRD7E_03560 [Bryobacteraceae bacterium]
MNYQIARRNLMLAAAGAGFLKAQSGPDVTQIVKRHDEGVERLLKMQNTDPQSQWRGGYPDANGLHHGGSGGGILESFTSAWLHPESRFHKSSLLMERMGLAAGFLNRVQSPDGNIDLLITNFNSPPDTGFVVRNVATAAFLARKYKEQDLFALMEPFLRKAGKALTVGGIHTPNHRWVVSAALSQLYSLFAEPAYVKRIDQWLAEGIDIDPDGQYTERSTVVYNAITNNALVTMAAKLGRPELLEPVRRNLESMLYLLHPGYEVVTEISRRQDVNQRGDLGSYWFTLQYLALLDGNGIYAGLADHFAPSRASLSALMEYPDLAKAGPERQAVPTDYEKEFPHLEVVRFRRGPVSATLLNGKDRFFTLRRGEAIISAVRFTSAFYGKGQFVPSKLVKQEGNYQLTQQLEAPYYQPLDPPRRVTPEQWDDLRALREQTEISRFEQIATLAELPAGFRLRIQAHGTRNVPVTVQLNLAADTKIEGCKQFSRNNQAYFLESGHGVVRGGESAIRFGPGLRLHSYTDVRGAGPELPGPSIYLTGYAPFDHTLLFEWA